MNYEIDQDTTLPETGLRIRMDPDPCFEVKKTGSDRREQPNSDLT